MKCQELPTHQNHRSKASCSKCNSNLAQEGVQKLTCFWNIWIDTSLTHRKYIKMKTPRFHAKLSFNVMYSKTIQKQDIMSS